MPLDEWINRDGTLILTERLYGEISNRMRNVLRTADFSTSILDSQEPDIILKTLFPIVGDKKILGARKQFEGLCQKWEKIREAENLRALDAPFFHLSAIEPTLSERVVKELAQQKLSGYYFLKSIELDGDDAGYVVLLREVHHIRREIINTLIRHGIKYSDFEEMCRTQPIHKGLLNILRDDVAMAVSVLESPHVEHMMQIFSNLFGRIGIPDISPEYTQELCQRQPSFRRFSA